MILSVEHPNFVEHMSIFQPQPKKTENYQSNGSIHNHKEIKVTKRYLMLL